MLHKFTSVEEVIGRIIRNTRLTDTTYIADMNEWIPEAMSYMRTRHTLVSRYKDVKIHFHVGELPCATVSVKAVEHAGYRLKSLGSLRAYGHPGGSAYPGITVQGNMIDSPENQWQTNLQTRTTPVDTTIYDAEPVSTSEAQCLGLPSCDYGYEIEGGFIRTSVVNGTLRVHYRSLPVDANDFPLIPDNNAYKEAIYWYVRSMMIGTGFSDPVFKFEYCDAKFRDSAARAIGQISYPALDSMDAKIPSITRFLPHNYLSHFNL